APDSLRHATGAGRRRWVRPAVIRSRAPWRGLCLATAAGRAAGAGIPSMTVAPPDATGGRGPCRHPAVGPAVDPYPWRRRGSTGWIAIDGGRRGVSKRTALV